MRKLLLLLLPFLPLCLQAQFAVPPKTLTNGTSYTNTVEIQRDQMYRWVISLRGPAHVVVRVHSSWNGINSGYVRADSVSLSSGSGFTDFIVQASGDSLMNQWLPDDSGSMGTAGSVMKARPGWKATITVQALSSGNGGLIALSTTSLTYAPPATDDTYAYTRWLAGIDYATPDMIISLPSQTGNNGKYLKTDGADLSWDTPAGGTGDTTGTTNQPMQSRLEDDVKAAKDTASAANKAANTADGKAIQAQSTANVAYNVAMGRRDSTSINGVKRRTFTLTAIGRLTITQTNDSTFEWSLDTTDFMQGPRITALEGSVAAAQDSARKANDSVRVVGPLATTTKNDLTSHIGTADAHLPSQTGASGKFLQSNGTVSSWQTALTAESDPTALAKASSVADSSLTNGNRSISSSGRIFVPDDSITFVGEAGDVVDARLGNVFRGTISGNDTLSISNMTDGQIISIVITNAGTHTLSWSGVNWAGGTAPILSATANKRDVFTIIRAGGIMYGSAVQDLR